jgi:hypothetical protein
VTFALVGGGSEPSSRIERVVGERIYTCGFQEFPVAGRDVNGLRAHGMGSQAVNVSQNSAPFPFLPTTFKTYWRQNLSRPPILHCSSTSSLITVTSLLFMTRKHCWIFSQRHPRYGRGGFGGWWVLSDCVEDISTY